MSQAFNADELFEIAEQIERDGAQFYRRAAEFTTAPQARAVLLELAEMEDQHVEAFAAMHREVIKQHPDWLIETTEPSGHDEAALYLRSIAEERVFHLQTDPAAQLTGKESPADILRTAVGLEKDSIVFYLGIKSVVPGDQGKDKVEDVIREEMAHIATLTRELAALEKK